MANIDGPNMELKNIPCFIDNKKIYSFPFGVKIKNVSEIHLLKNIDRSLYIKAMFNQIKSGKLDCTLTETEYRAIRLILMQAQFEKELKKWF